MAKAKSTYSAPKPVVEPAPGETPDNPIGNDPLASTSEEEAAGVEAVSKAAERLAAEQKAGAEAAAKNAQSQPGATPPSEPTAPMPIPGEVVTADTQPIAAE
jgi:hypothetical protein